MTALDLAQVAPNLGHVTGYRVTCPSCPAYSRHASTLQGAERMADRHNETSGHLDKLEPPPPRMRDPRDMWEGWRQTERDGQI